MVRVKICGITSLRDAWAALDAGADALGFNFHPASPRKVSPGEARSIIRTLPPLCATFGVFAGEERQVMVDLAQTCGFRFIQAPHGDVLKLLSISRKQLNVLSTSPIMVPVVRVKGAREVARAARIEAPLLLLDPFHPTKAGGTGRTFRWSLLKRTRPKVPFLLAGGLTPANVRRAIRAARPYGVDVCSGVERSPGVKDHVKLKAFIRAAKAVR